jgi:hypothetical protein
VLDSLHLAINEIDMEFKEIKNVNIETIGSLSQITRPCPIEYKSMKAQHEQVEVDRSQTLWSTIFYLHRFCNPCIYIPYHKNNYKVVICCQK